MLWIAIVENDMRRTVRITKYCSDFKSNWPINISASHTSISPTKHDVINGLFEIRIPTKIPKDKIYWK